jgi:hypothetical protein
LAISDTTLVRKEESRLQIKCRTLGSAFYICWRWRRRASAFIYLFIYLFIYFCSTGAWTQSLHLKPLHQPFFVMGFFKIGSCKLFVLADFKSRSSWSLPAE